SNFNLAIAALEEGDWSARLRSARIFAGIHALLHSRATAWIRVEQLLTQRTENSAHRGSFSTRIDFEIRDGFELLNRGLNRLKDLLIALVTVQIHDHVRDPRNQTAKHLALHWREIKEAVKHQQLNLLKPGQRNFGAIEFAPQNFQRAQLVGVFVRQPNPIQRRSIGGINESDFAIVIELGCGLRLAACDLRLEIVRV